MDPNRGHHEPARSQHSRECLLCGHSPKLVTFCSVLVPKRRQAGCGQTLSRGQNSTYSGVV